MCRGVQLRYDCGDEMIDLVDISARLDGEEELTLAYKFPVRNEDGTIDYKAYEGKLLDVDEKAGRLFVSHDGEVVWVTANEVIEIKPSA